MRSPRNMLWSPGGCEACLINATLFGLNGQHASGCRWSRRSCTGDRLLSLLCDDRMLGMIVPVAEIELHDEVEHWINGLDDADWDRVRIVIDRWASLGSLARMPFSKPLPRLDVTPNHVPVYERWQGRTVDNVPQTTEQRAFRSCSCSQGG